MSKKTNKSNNQSPPQIIATDTTIKSKKPNNPSPPQAVAADTTIKSKKPNKNIIFLLIVTAVAVVGTLTGVLAWYFSMPSIESAFKSIEKNKNYAYTAYASRPSSSQIIYVKNTHNKRYVDSGVNQFTVDYSLSSENVGVYTEINNVWVFEEVFRGSEGSGLSEDNRALKAFDLASENLKDNFTYNKSIKRYELKEASFYKVFSGTLSGSCEIYRKGNKIYVDAFYGLDKNNKERIVITKVGGVSIKLPEITSLGLE